MSKRGGEEAAGPGVVAGDHLANQPALRPLTIQRMQLASSPGVV